MARSSRMSARNARETASPTNLPEIPDAFTRVGATVRSVAGTKRKIPTITLRGEWLKALGFPVDAPIYLLAEAHGRMAICRPGLRRPRWLRIVAPKKSR